MLCFVGRGSKAEPECILEAQFFWAEQEHSDPTTLVTGGVIDVKCPLVWIIDLRPVGGQLEHEVSCSLSLHSNSRFEADVVFAEFQGPLHELT